jgi:WD40 repeat protein
VAAGTDLVGHEAHVDLWDMRFSGPGTLLGSLTDSFGDDVTQVVFHPSLPHVLITGSTDGLVCAFDTPNMSDEDEALTTVMNTESSVSKIGFYGPSWENVFALTHIETALAWEWAEVRCAARIIRR